MVVIDEGETTEDVKTFCNNRIALVRKVTLRLSSSVLQRHGQKPLEPPSLFSKVASLRWPGALELHLELSCAHPP